MDDQSAPSWQYIPPNSGPLPPNIKVVTTTHTGEAMDDILERLRTLWVHRVGTDDDLISIYGEAADEIERLRKERDEARRELAMIMAGRGGKSSFVSPDALRIAEERGWDCFNKECM